MLVSDLERLRTPEGEQLLAEATRRLPVYDRGVALAVSATLREQWPAELVSAALTQIRLRRQAEVKFGPLAGSLFFTPDGLEQATGWTLAQRRAQRYVAAGVSRVADLGCGIGADTLALSRAGLAVRAFERNPLTAAVARANAEALGVGDLVEVREADVRALGEADLAGCDAAFCDPARRNEQGRRMHPESWSPPFSWLLQLAENVPATAAKVAPGIAHDLLPPGTEAEWVSVAGDVKEAALWWGPLAGDMPRRATVLPAGDELTGSGTSRGEVRSVQRYLYEPDGAVIRAGLVAEAAAELEGGLIDPTIAYVTSDILRAPSWATAYEVTDVLPFSLKRLRTLLRERGVGSAVIKKRGSAVEPEQLRAQLRLSGPSSAVVFLTRVEGRPSVLLARVPAASAQPDLSA